jgi:hypothetical protein
MRLTRLLAAAAAGALALGLAAPYAGGSEEATSTVSVIHGIPGDDIGLDNALPVDVLVNGELCALTGFVLGDIERLELPAGTYDVEVRLSDGACGGPVAIDAPGIEVPAGINATVIAHLDDAGVPSASVFVNDMASAAGGEARVTVHHTAAAPTVDVWLTPGEGYNRIGYGDPAVMIDGLSNGDAAALDVPARGFVADVYPTGVTQVDAFLYALPADLEAGNLYNVYAIGGLATGGFGFIIDVQPLG